MYGLPRTWLSAICEPTKVTMEALVTTATKPSSLSTANHEPMLSRAFHLQCTHRHRHHHRHGRSRGGHRQAKDQCALLDLRQNTMSTWVQYCDMMTLHGCTKSTK